MCIGTLRTTATRIRILQSNDRTLNFLFFFPSSSTGFCEPTVMSDKLRYVCSDDIYLQHKGLVELRRLVCSTKNTAHECGALIRAGLIPKVSSFLSAAVVLTLHTATHCLDTSPDYFFLKGQYTPTSSSGGGLASYQPFLR